jgi:tetratricopeptide (TPR) repeat protein
LHRLREEGRGVLAHRVAQFLKIAGLCGSAVPVQLITHYLGLSEDEEDELIDSIDEYFIGNVEAPLFQDLAYSHPGFPEFAVYAFANPVLQRVLVHRLGIDEHERVKVAARFYRHLQEVMPVRSRAVATLYVSVLEQANEEAKRQAMESELAWWVGVEEAEALQTHLTQRLKKRELDSEALWLLYERIKNRWPAYRRLAVLGAYREQPNGIPWNRASYWYHGYASTLYELGRYEEAREAAREGIGRLQESGSPMEGALVSMRGAAEVALGFLKEAETSFRWALETLEKALGPNHPDVAASLSNLAGLYDAQGRYAEAEPLLRRALGVWEKTLGPDHPHMAISLHNLAALYLRQGRYAEAEPLLRRALEILEKALGPNHPGVATSLHYLAGLYYAQGRYAEAEPLYRRALEIREKALGPDHPHVATSLNDLAALYRDQGRYAEAEPLHRRALGIREIALGPDHPDVATSLHTLATLYHAQGRYAEAEPLLRRALGIREKALDLDHPHVAISLNNLAMLYHAQGRYAEAEPLLRRVLGIREKAFGPDHPHVATVLKNYAALLRKLDRITEAESMETRAQAIQKRLASQK